MDRLPFKARLSTSAFKQTRIPGTERRRHRRRVLCCAQEKESSVKRLAVFVSGTGSNFKRIHASCVTKKINGEVVLVVTNNPECPAADFALSNGIPVQKYPWRNVKTEEHPLVYSLRDAFCVDFVLLAGYIKRIPSELIEVMNTFACASGQVGCFQVYPRAILNIHPALLPAFGGKGYYGTKVHEAVLASGAKYSGASVHFVAEEYDCGVILDQRVVPVLQNDTPQTLADRVLEQEHELYSACVSALCDDRIVWNENGVPFIQ